MKRPVGRPTKKGAKKSGDLNPRECRFSFIADADTIKNLKKEASNRNMTIKALMTEVLKRFKTKKELKVHEKKLKVNEKKLQEFLKRIDNPAK